MNLRVALDYIIENNLPFYMKDDVDRHIYHLYRTGRMQEVETSALSQEDFVRHYDEATEPVREAVGQYDGEWFYPDELTILCLAVETFEAWTLLEEGRVIPPVPKTEAAQAYAAASQTLKVVTSVYLLIHSTDRLTDYFVRLDACNRLADWRWEQLVV